MATSTRVSTEVSIYLFRVAKVAEEIRNLGEDDNDHFGRLGDALTLINAHLAECVVRVHHQSLPDTTQPNFNP